MRMNRHRGQVLVLASLAIALVILSTQAYVYRLSRSEVSSGYDSLSDYTLSIEQGSRHAVVASLANVSDGGASSSMGVILDEWEAFVAGDYSFGRCEINASLASQPPYSDGIWLEWGVPGEGVSSAYADFTLNLSGRGAEIDWGFGLNVTTKILVNGSYSVILGDEKEVTVDLSVLNDGSPALAGSTTLLYFKAGEWTDATGLGNFTATDYGTGSYRYTFIDTITEDPIQVRVQVYDLRGVFVQAEADLSSV